MGEMIHLSWDVLSWEEGPEERGCAMSETVTQEQVLEALEGIIDPDLGKSVVQAGFVKNLTIQGGRVSFDLELTTPACPLKSQFQKKAQELVGNLPGVKSVEVRLTSRVRQAQPQSQKPLLPGVKLMVAGASGKGGVGKSTVAANLAVALARTGAATGLVDVDVYGPSAQIMFGIPQGSRPDVNADQKLIPLEAHGVKIMSMAFLARDDTPILWRGPLVAKLVQDFLAHVEWGELDYLVVDLPPGTGDAQLTLCQSAPLAGAVIVTTPQDVSLVDARKGLELFRKVNVPVLGIVENMSYFLCPHCGERTEIFRHGGGEKVARQLGVAFLGEIPL
ncbi:MAG TPA: iron-sulfur cluster carrier protein ApbC, partial [Planctomycetes bacterium]|nr:iron-sulfur cluster carrier protein ApbC [Planctomycetota bacterium]